MLVLVLLVALLAGARALAFLRRRAYVVPDDVKAVAYDVLRHRVALTYEAEAENETDEELRDDAHDDLTGDDG